MNASHTELRTQDRLLFALKTRGPLTTAELSAHLDITVPGVRQHLVRLADDGLVVATDDRRGVGRPAQLWSLTDSAQNRFPDAHAEMTVELIGAIRSSLGEAALNDVVEHRSREVEVRYRGSMDPGDDLAAQVHRLAELRSIEGYMAEVVDEANGWLLIENHCPICAAAATCQGFCANELELFRSLLGASVQRVEFIQTGARRCAYRIAPLGEEHAA